MRFDKVEVGRKRGEITYQNKMADICNRGVAAHKRQAQRANHELEMMEGGAMTVWNEAGCNIWDLMQARGWDREEAKGKCIGMAYGSPFTPFDLFLWTDFVNIWTREFGQVFTPEAVPFDHPNVAKQPHVTWRNQQ